MIRARLKQSHRYRTLKDFFTKHERLMIPGMLICGVIADFITFRTIQYSTAFMLLGVYFFVALTIVHKMIFMKAKLLRTQFDRYFLLTAPLVLQFLFGALLSASLVFYWFSGIFSVSWPIIFLLAALMTSNDVLRHLYRRPAIQIPVLFFICFSLSTLILPFFVHSIDAWVFLLGGMGSLFFIMGYIKFLSSRTKRIREREGLVTVLVLGIFIMMNGLYFLNIIPPIPLSLREAGVYHNIVRSGVDWHLGVEEENIIERIIPGQRVHIVKGDPLYAYSSVYSPDDLDVTIVHHWQRYDEEDNEWVTEDELSFSVLGGRDDGFRGYSVKRSLEQGKWRVNVETERGQVLGRMRFSVQFVQEEPELLFIAP